MFFVDFCTWSSIMGARAQRLLKKCAGAECCSLFFYLPDRKLPTHPPCAIRQPVIATNAAADSEYMIVLHMHWQYVTKSMLCRCG